MKQINKVLFLLVFLLLLTLLKSQLYSLHTFGQEDSDISKLIYVLETNLSSKLISHVYIGPKKLVALTFDDGPDPKYTAEILSILKRNQVRATFFVVGENAKKYPEIIKKEIEEGHEIENHTYTHPDLSQESNPRTGEEIQKTQQLLSEIGEIRLQFFRPPKKLYRPETIQIAEANGYKTVLWSICVENQKAKTPELMAQRVIAAARPGIIILAHDGRMDRSRTVQALPRIIEEYHNLGYEFVTLDELLKNEVK